VIRLAVDLEADGQGRFRMIRLEGLTIYFAVVYTYYDRILV